MAENTQERPIFPKGRPKVSDALLLVIGDQTIRVAKAAHDFERELSILTVLEWERDVALAGEKKAARKPK